MATFPEENTILVLPAGESGAERMLQGLALCLPNLEQRKSDTFITDCFQT